MCQCLFCTDPENPCVQIYNIVFEPIGFEPNREIQTTVITDFKKWLKAHPRSMWSKEQTQILRDTRKLLLEQWKTFQAFQAANPNPDVTVKSQFTPLLQLFRIN